MKIKIHKKLVLKERRLDEAAPLLALAARLGPMLAKWGPRIASAVNLGGGDDAEELLDKSRIDPLDVESKSLTQHTQLLDDIKQVLQGINASIAKLPQDPNAVSATGDTGGEDAGEASVLRSPASKDSPSSRGFPKGSPVNKAIDRFKGVIKKPKVVGPREGKKRANNLKYLF